MSLVYQGVGSRESGVGSRESGVGSRELRIKKAVRRNPPIVSDFSCLKIYFINSL
ncbi:MAG: hypothetical protein F6J90_11255 [Moorea sp. SIOASIH]|uniref:hypothetical protein n=1 Tax=Moorena sp. SIOASIH TaxID=2607817 RepID=UPI0013BCB1F5|nr:hypothetical protein [Moorena sp. SIOASIH]NEO36854.1 hypothetical protein [Moorena sp. SIOASIH]